MTKIITETKTGTSLYSTLSSSIEVEIANFKTIFKDGMFELSNEYKTQAIENHIYSQYSKDKQAQDQVWTDNFRTKLVVMGMGVEAKVVGGVKAFMGGVTIAEYLKDENVETMPLLEKLIKIGVRSEWAYWCIVEGKKAIAEDREPVYAEYPNV